MQRDVMFGPALIGLFASACSSSLPAQATTRTSSAELTTGADAPASSHPRTVAIDPLPAAEIDAGRAFRSIHPQLLACYVNRLATNPTAHAYVIFDVSVGEDGHPRAIETTGGALLGAETLGCMIRHIGRVAFAPPSVSGTSHVQVPFAFEVEAVDP